MRGAEPELEPAFAEMANQRIGGLMVTAWPFLTLHREQIVRLAAQRRIPAIYGFREYAAVGGLMSYGNNLKEETHQVGLYVGRILHGEKPAGLPVVQSTRFEFVINLKTAAALGLTIPPAFMTLADELIE